MPANTNPQCPHRGGSLGIWLTQKGSQRTFWAIPAPPGYANQCGWILMTESQDIPARPDLTNPVGFFAARLFWRKYMWLRMLCSYACLPIIIICNLHSLGDKAGSGLYNKSVQRHSLWSSLTNKLFYCKAGKKMYPFLKIHFALVYWKSVVLMQILGTRCCLDGALLPSTGL